MDFGRFSTFVETVDETSVVAAAANLLEAIRCRRDLDRGRCQRHACIKVTTHARLAALPLTHRLRYRRLPNIAGLVV
jgi:hypothetical protein